MIFTLRFPGEPLPKELEHLGREVIEVPSELLEGLVAAMDVAGCIDDAALAPTIPPWPPGDVRVGSERAEELYDILSDLEAEDREVPEELPDVTPDERGALASYAELTRSIRSAGSLIPGRVPSYKFETTESWHVTAAECQTIARGLAHLLADEDAMARLLADLEGWMVPVGLAGETLDWLPDWQAVNAHGGRGQGYIVS